MNSKKILCLFLFCLSINFSLVAQDGYFTSNLYDTYEKYSAPSLDKRRVKHADIQPLIDSFGDKPGFTVTRVGASIEGRRIRMISVGTGSINVFLWSQMHGNEPTATLAIFDILTFLSSPDFADEKRKMLQNLKIHFLPMLNPDGAQVYQRRNRLGIDINRDALRLQSPEGRILKKVRDSLKADFGFNLHDQSIYYNAERTEKPATISYLAPAYNYEKDINEVRGNAMKIIVFMNNIIQKYAPGQVGRYNDDFEPRAFGDNIQKWGTSTILIESGGYPNDIEKQEIRKLNYVSLLAAIYAIANGSYAKIPLAEYTKIPENDRKLFDLKIQGATYPLLGREYLLDIGINRLEVDLEGHQDFWYSSRILDLGDLSTFYGYETLDARGLTITQGKVYPQTLQTIGQLRDFKVMEALRKGYTYVRVKNISPKKAFIPLPIQVLGETHELPEFNLELGVNPTFILARDGVNRYAVINGFLIDLESGEKAGIFNFAGKNGMIYR
ncbi:MAG: M14 metallopeptidase family protein [Bacteroidota bacterium]